MRITVRREYRTAAVAVLAVIGTIGVDIRTAAAQATQRRPTVQELQRRLDERDAVIEDLRRRVEELERWTQGRPAAAAQPAPPLPAPAPPPTAASESPIPPEPATAAAPGQFEVDEEAVERALEVALVQEGALLLRPGTVEVRPGFSYARQEDRASVFFNQGGQSFLATDDAAVDVLEADLTLRFGLPFESQLDIDIPYRYEDTTTVTRIGFAGVSEESADGAGLGDIAIAFSKGLLRERGWRPDLIGRLEWDTDTGQSDGDVDLGSGFDEFEASLTAVKRFDPLVFIGGLSYRTALEEDGIDPGDEVGLALGTVLAASPDASLRFLLRQSFSDQTERDGTEIPGTDDVASTFEVGVSTILAPRMLLDVSAEIGLTDDAADYVFRVSLPIRFDLPKIGS